MERCRAAFQHVPPGPCGSLPPPWVAYLTASMPMALSLEALLGGTNHTEANTPAESQASRSQEQEGRAILNSSSHYTDEEMHSEKLPCAFKISMHVSDEYLLLT